MNERIKELIEQAGIESYTSKLLVNTDEEGKVSSKWEIPLEKFAELIVKECMLCCERVISDPVLPESVDTWLNGGLSCIDEIKEHFGVEE